VSGGGPAGDEGDDRGDRPARDLELETLAGVLDGEILVQNHCYRADEMAQMIDSAKEFGYRSPPSTTRSRPTRSPTCWPRTASAARCGPTGGASRWRPTTASARTPRWSTRAGACAVIVHSDSPNGIQRLNQEAAKAMAAAARAGLDGPASDAIGWITATPPAPSASTASPAASSRARWPTWCCGHRPVQRLRAGRPGVDRRRPGLRPRRPGAGGAAPAARATAAAPASRTAAAPGPADLDGETVAITGATVHTAGAAGTLENATVVIAGGRIAAVGRDVAVPPGARVIDGRGRIVTPACSTR
jgi:hypothetical protein